MSEDSFSDVEEIELVDETKRHLEPNTNVPKRVPVGDLPGFVDFRHALTDEELNKDIRFQTPTPLIIETKQEHETKIKYTVVSSSNKMDSAPKTLGTGLNMHQVHKDFMHAAKLGAVEFNPKQIETKAIGDYKTTKQEDALFRCKPEAWNEYTPIEKQKQQKHKKSAMEKVFVGPLANLKKAKITEIQQITAADLISVDEDKKTDGAWMRLFGHLSCIKDATQVIEMSDIANKEISSARDQISSKKDLQKTWWSFLPCVGKNRESMGDNSVKYNIPVCDMPALTANASSGATKVILDKLQEPKGQTKVGILQRIFKIKKSGHGKGAPITDADSSETQKCKKVSSKGHKKASLFGQLHKRLQSRKPQ